MLHMKISVQPENQKMNNITIEMLKQWFDQQHLMIKSLIAGSLTILAIIFVFAMLIVALNLFGLEGFVVLIFFHVFHIYVVHSFEG